jgi:peptidoglycan/LPS O-acetylase OafA/YrhL
MAGLFQSRLTPTGPVPAPLERDLALEGLRGLCALLVLYGHVFAPIPCLDPVYSPPSFFSWLDEARPAVLFFFVLSGYVIGLTVKSGFGGSAVKGYLGRRALRLVPINTAAVLMSWALAPRTAASTVLGNLAFLQNYNIYLFGWHVPVMANDASLWTLNFEVFYYLVFLAVWRYAPRVGVFLGFLALAAAAAAFPVFPPFLSCYVIGGLYWFAGLSVAWLGPRPEGNGNWPSALLATAVLWPVASLEVLLGRLDFPDLNVPPLALKRLDLLAACLWLLLATTGRSPRWQRRLGLICLSLATVALVERFLTGEFGDRGRGAFLVYAAVLVAGWMSLEWRPRPALLAWLAPTGGVSFGIYAVSLALQFSILFQPSLPRGTPLSYALRLALVLGLSTAIAWLLEHRLQPALRRRFITAGPAAARPRTA